MFEQKALMFLYCISPVHPGAGTALGVIDSPIQRERHTNYPSMAGAGIKGALREYCGHRWEPAMTKKVFGPAPSNSGEHAGAVSFSDGQLVLFPVRSPNNSYYYVTSPTALARLLRLASLADVDVGEWKIPQPISMQYVSLDGSTKDAVYLEAFKLEPDKAQPCAEIANWLSQNVLSQSGFDFFKEKIGSDTLVVDEAAFKHFVEHATLVEPHVRIDDATGTAQDGGLFYVENLPPESLLVSLMMASRERKKEGEVMQAAEIIETVSSTLSGQMVQLGGDSTTGRGQVVLSFVEPPNTRKKEG